MFKGILYCTLLFTVIIAGCKQKDPPYYMIEPFTKSLFDWQPGSYWIMQDSATGRIDSFYIISYTTGTHKGYDRNYETLNIEISEVNLSTPTDITPWFVGIEYAVGVALGYSVSGSTVQYLHFLEDTAHNNKPFTTNGVTYQNVYFNNLYTEPQAYLNVAINKQYGFIYIHTLNDSYYHTWYLLRHKVISKP